MNPFYRCFICGQFGEPFASIESDQPIDGEKTLSLVWLSLEKAGFTILNLPPESPDYPFALRVRIVYRFRNAEVELPMFDTDWSGRDKKEFPNLVHAFKQICPDEVLVIACRKSDIFRRNYGYSFLAVPRGSKLPDGLLSQYAVESFDKEVNWIAGIEPRFHGEICLPTGARTWTGAVWWPFSKLIY